MSKTEPSIYTKYLLSSLEITKLSKFINVYTCKAYKAYCILIENPQKYKTEVFQHANYRLYVLSM